MRFTLALIALGLVAAVFVILLITGNLTKLPTFAAFEGPAMIGFILVLFIPGAFGHPWLGTYGMDDPGGR